MNFRKLLLILFILFSPDISHAGEPGFEFDRDRRRIRVPVKISQNLIVVPVSINGSAPLNFILDTGIRTTILTEPLMAEMLGLGFDESIFVFGLGGEGIVEATRSRDVTIQIRGVTGKNMNLIILPEDVLSFSEMMGFPVHGIIGYDFFKNFPVEINHHAQTLQIYRDQNYRIGRRSNVIPLQIIDQKPYVKATLVGQNADTVTTNLLVDLGASHAAYVNNKHLRLSDITIQSFLGQGLSGNLTGRMGRVEKLIIHDKIAVDDVLVAYPDKEFITFFDQEIEWEGIIGGEILKRFDIIFDYQAEQMVLRRNFQFRKPFTPNLSGMEVIAEGRNFNKFMVHKVRPGSSAYEAGIMAGDQIISINHKRAQQIRLDDIFEKMTGNPGRVITMILLRNGETFRTSFRLREDI